MAKPTTQKKRARKASTKKGSAKKHGSSTSSTAKPSSKKAGSKTKSGRRGAKKSKTESFKSFARSIKRANAYVDAFGRTGGRRKKGQPTKAEVDLLRGAVVFAIGALDAFLHDVVLEVVPDHPVNSEELKGALKAIAKTDPGLALRVALAPTRVGAQQAFREALDDWLSERSFHGVKGVERAMSYLDLGWPKQGLDRLVGHSGSAKDLERFTTMRHGLVHRATSPSLKRDAAEEAIKLVETVAKAVNDAAIAKYFNK